MAKKKSKKKSSKKTSRKKSRESLIVGSKVKAAIKSAGCNSSSDVQDALNDYVYWLVEQAAGRASANGRKTVRAHDFLVC